MDDEVLEVCTIEGESSPCEHENGCRCSRLQDFEIAPFNVIVPLAGVGEPAVEEREELLKQAHCETLHGNFQLMVDYIRSRNLWWTDIHKDARGIAMNCIQCLGYNPAKRGFLRSKTVDATLPWEHIQVDLVGPLDMDSLNGSKYIMKVIDVLTKYMELIPIKDKSAASTANALLGVIGRYGVPKIVSSDLGTEFVNEIWRSLKNRWGFQHALSAAYNPRSIGLVEKAGFSLRGLHKWRVQYNLDWEMLLPSVQLAFNSRVSPVTQLSPFQLLHRRPPPDLVDYADAQSSLSGVAWKARLEVVDEELIPMVIEAQLVQKEKQKERVDRSHRVDVQWPIGTCVMIRFERRNKGQSSYTGPFWVHGYDDRDNYILRDNGNTVLKRVVPHDQLKLAGNDVGEFYAVDRLLKSKVEGRVTKYLVRWWGYEPEDDAWEPEQNIQDKRFIKELEAAKKKFPRDPDPVLRWRDFNGSDGPWGYDP